MKTLTRRFRNRASLLSPACATGLLLITCGSVAGGATATSGMSPLQIEGGRVVDGEGSPVALRGCNLGNWLVLEMWMLDLRNEGVNDQYELEQLLGRRFGEEGRRAVMEAFRSHWITERDLALVKSFGMNTVRLPFSYELLMDDERPFELRPGAWTWLDRAVDLAERHGMYVLLDLHGAPGRQSAMDHTGRRDHNRLWADADAQAQTVWLWKRIAERYRDRASVAAYDLLNEPWGSSEQDLKDIIERLYDAVRTVDKETIIVFPGHYAGIDFYGDPRERGRTNVIFTMHFYPGFFGWGRPDLHVHADFLSGGLEDWAARMKKLQTPLLIGEFNVVMKRAGGGEMMRRYFDFYNGQGWPATMWSYKVLSARGGIGAGSWGMVTNRDPLPGIDLHGCDLEEALRWCRSLSVMPYQADEDLRHWLTTDAPTSSLDHLPPPPPPRTKPPARDALPEGWHAADIGDALPGGQRVDVPDGKITVYGGGSDIWAESDQFRFLYREVRGDFTLTVVVDELEDTHPYAKAGVMVRAGPEPDAAHVLLNAFPGGQLEFGYREAPGETMQARPGGEGQLPGLRLRITRSGDVIAAYSTHGEEPFGEPLGRLRMPGLGDEVLAGLAVLSHDNERLTRAAFRAWRPAEMVNIQEP